MSVRGIGEGHRSSIGFRTGVVDANGHATIDEAGPVRDDRTCTGPPLLDAAVFRAELGRLDHAGEAADYVLDALGDLFTRADLDERLDNLRAHLSTRGHAERTIELIREHRRRASYAVEFPDDVMLSERVLWPAMDAEQAGMEDARFVRFVDDDGAVTYYATYTAYSGSHISQQLLETKDFQTFTSAPLVGRAAANKGLALFPRRIDGRYAAMSRSDRETEHRRLRRSPVGLDERVALPAAHRAVGGAATRKLRSANRNRRGMAGARPTASDRCAPTASGRSCSISTIRPGCSVGCGDRCSVPRRDEQDGYVPNVVYSCGALVHADTLVIPYGIGDAAIGLATVPLPELLAAMVEQPGQLR